MLKPKNKAGFLAKKLSKKQQMFARQERKNMGTWLDSKQTYAEIMENANDLAKEVLYEMQVLGQSCDSGGCTD